MNKVIDHLKKRGVSDILSIIAFVFALTGLILYYNTGITEFSSELSSAFLTAQIITVILDFIFLVFSSRLGKLLTFAVALYAFVEYINSQINYIANVFVSIDGSTFTAGFIFCLISIIISLGTVLAAGITAKDEIREFLGLADTDEIKVVKGGEEHE